MKKLLALLALGAFTTATHAQIDLNSTRPAPQVKGVVQTVNGGTGATTQAGANGALGIPGPICNVMGYGATGNGITNDHNAIQAAEDACYINGGSLYFPTRFAGTGTTVYYTATPIIFKGVPMFGPPGSSGPFGSYLTETAVAIQGGAGQDVFNVPDPTSGGYVVPRNSYTVQDLGIFVDVSMDASASHLNRKIGRTCKDVVTNGTAVITSAAQCEFQPGDVGQSIKVASTTTTVLSYQSATQVTLNTTVGAATGVTVSVGAMGLTATASIGNCGFCYDDATGIAGAISKSVFRDVVIRNVNGANYANSTSGFFFQGNASPTWTRWENVSVVGTTHGFSFVPVSTVAPSTSFYTGIADYNLWDHVFIGASYPLLAYSGELQEIRGMQLIGDDGPQLINAYGRVSKTSNWKIDIPEEETASCPSVSGQSWRISGIQHEISRLSIGMCNGAVIQWDASDSTVSALGTGTYTANFNVTGNLNHFNYPDGSDLLTAYLTLNQTGMGYGNTFTSGTLWNSYNGRQPGREMFANPGLNGLSTAPYSTPQLTRGRKALERTSDMLRNGADSSYFNDEDLMMEPDELGSSGYTIILADDATSRNGRNFLIPGSGSFSIYALNEVNLFIGSQIPAKKLTVYFRLKSAASASVNTFIVANGSTLTSCPSFATIPSTYTTYACVTDLTGLTGQTFRIAFSNPSTDTFGAWIGIKPWDSDATATKLTVGAGTSTMYRCVGGTLDGYTMWKASVCTGAGGTTTSTAITTP